MLSSGSRAAAALALLCLSACRGDQHGFTPPPPVVEVITVEPETVRDTITLVGQLDSESSVEVRPEIDGIIESIDFTEGQTRQEGRRAAPPARRRAAAHVREAQGAREAGRGDLPAHQPRSPSSEVSAQAEFDKATAELEVARAEVQLREVELEKTQRARAVRRRGRRAPRLAGRARAPQHEAGADRRGRPAAARVRGARDRRAVRARGHAREDLREAVPRDPLRRRGVLRLAHARRDHPPAHAEGLGAQPRPQAAARAVREPRGAARRARERAGRAGLRGAGRPDGLVRVADRRRRQGDARAGRDRPAQGGARRDHERARGRAIGSSRPARRR